MATHIITRFKITAFKHPLQHDDTRHKHGGYIGSPSVCESNKVRRYRAWPEFNKVFSVVEKTEGEHPPHWLWLAMTGRDYLCALWVVEMLNGGGGTFGRL